MTTKDMGPEPVGPFHAIFERVRRGTAQPACDLVHRETGVAWHRLAFGLVIASAALHATFMAIAIAMGALSPWREPTWFILYLLFEETVMIVLYAAMIRHQAAFCRKATADRFIAYDPIFRNPRGGEAIAVLTMVIATLVIVETWVTTEAILCAAAGCGDAHASDIAGCACLTAGFAVMVAAILAAACERSGGGRRVRRRGDVPTRRLTADA